MRLAGDGVGEHGFDEADETFDGRINFSCAVTEGEETIELIVELVGGLFLTVCHELLDFLFTIGFEAGNEFV